MLPARPIILGTGDTALGVVFLSGSPLRTSSAAYTGIKEVAPISAWGLVLLIFGLLLLISACARPAIPPHQQMILERAAATLAAAWCAFWAATLAGTAAHDPHVSWAGPVLWLAFAVIPHLFLAFGREG